MRPNPIIYFERIMFGTLALGIFQICLSWKQAAAIIQPISRNPLALSMTIATLIFAIIATLTILISRRRSKVAMWCFIIMFVLGLPYFIKSLFSGEILGSGAIGGLQAVGQMVAIVLLFTRISRLWMNGADWKGENLMDVFR